MKQSVSVSPTGGVGEVISITQSELYRKYLREEWYDIFSYKDYEYRVEKSGILVTEKSF